MVWLQKDRGRVRVGDMNANQGQRTRIAIDAVVSDVNLVALILAGSIGPSGFVAASLVCKAWLSVCREDERMLGGLAGYHGVEGGSSIEEARETMDRAKGGWEGRRGRKSSCPGWRADLL